MGSDWTFAFEYYLNFNGVHFRKHLVDNNIETFVLLEWVSFKNLKKVPTQLL
jgi:hypothetical protein